MPSDRFTVLVDSNVFISAFAFGGIPDRVVQALLKRHFVHVTAPPLLQEIEKNLVQKFNLSHQAAAPFLEQIKAVSTLVIPSGRVSVTGHLPDDLVLESALLGGCDVLVTGDKRHLLPLKSFRGLVLESPAEFLKRLPPAA